MEKERAIQGLIIDTKRCFHFFIHETPQVCPIHSDLRKKMNGSKFAFKIIKRKVGSENHRRNK